LDARDKSNAGAGRLNFGFPEAETISCNDPLRDFDTAERSSHSWPMNSRP
jgi:hypothetical protein